MLTLLIVVGYLATTVLPASWAMRWATGRPWFLGCSRFPSWSQQQCQRSHREHCWIKRGQFTAWSIGAGLLIGLLWPLAVLPSMAAHLAMRKPTPGALQRRIAELEKEVDL